MLGFLVRKHDHAVFVLDFFKEHFELGPDHDAIRVHELVLGDEAFGFVTDVHQHFIWAHVDHGALDDTTFRELLHSIREILFHWVSHTTFDYLLPLGGLTMKTLL